MQPFQCDLQPQSQETHRTTHTGTTTRSRTQRRNRLTSKRSKPQPPHTRGTFHRRLQPLYTEKYKVSCSGFLPKTKPMQHSCTHNNAFCSMTWLPGYPACIYAHGNTRWQQSCTHSNAICNHRFNKRIKLRTQEQPLVAEHRGGTDWPRNDPNRNRRWKVPRVCGGCGLDRFEANRFLLCVLQRVVVPVCEVLCVSWLCGCRSHWNGCMIVVIWCCHVRPDDNNHAAIPMRSATTCSRNA